MIRKIAGAFGGGACHHPERDARARRHLGRADTEHDNVGAMVVDWPGYGPYQFCSGTLIHPRLF
jgi:hypothetical protein